MKTIIALCLVLALVSCAVVPPVESPLEFKTLGAISYWVDQNIIYASDPLGGAWDTWQMPATTLERGKGDCEDISLLWLYLVYEAFGKKGVLIISNVPEKGLHCSARLGAYDFYGDDEDTELYTISYDQAMSLAQIKALKEGVR